MLFGVILSLGEYNGLAEKAHSRPLLVFRTLSGRTKLCVSTGRVLDLEWSAASAKSGGEEQEIAMTDDDGKDIKKLEEKIRRALLNAENTEFKCSPTVRSATAPTGRHHEHWSRATTWLLVPPRDCRNLSLRQTEVLH
jgi:hypothetical protein